VYRSSRRKRQTKHPALLVEVNFKCMPATLSGPQAKQRFFARRYRDRGPEIFVGTSEKFYTVRENVGASVPLVPAAPRPCLFVVIFSQTQASQTQACAPHV